MRILLIGATGQIGYALTNALATTPHQVAVLVRAAHKLPLPANVQAHEAQTFTPEVFEAALKDVDAVIYGVGVPLQPTFDDQMWQKLNYGLLKTFLEVLGRSPVRRLIYISTVEVFQPVQGVVRESNPLIDPGSASPYARAMLQAYQMVTDWAAQNKVVLTTMHPVALYGGLNTGQGTNAFMESLINHESSKVPMIIDSRFPVVHAESLASAFVRALDQPGSYLVSDQMTSMKELALMLQSQAGAFMPRVVPVWLATSGVSAMEAMARLMHSLPNMTRAQIDFVAHAGEPKTGRAEAELGWRPMPLEAGIRKYLQDRTRLLALMKSEKVPA